MAAAAGASEVDVLIAGDGEERTRIERAIELAGVGDRVRLLGEVDEEALPALLASCHVFALPSKARTEGLGVSLVEAMRYGKALSSVDWAEQRGGDRPGRRERHPCAARGRQRSGG